MKGSAARRRTGTARVPLPARSWIAASAALTLLFFPAAVVYFHNVLDFHLAFIRILPGLLAATLLLAILLLALWALIPARWRTTFVSLLVVVTVGAWIQGQLLVGDYGLLDGTAIDWGRFRILALVEVAGWAMLLVAGIRLADFVNRHAMVICALVVGIQSVGLAVAVRQAPEAPSFHHYRVSGEDRFRLSEDRNVVVVVLDAFQSDLFQEMLVHDPEFAEPLEGFTYFRNATAGYAKTYPTLALMLSGRWYENREPLQDFLRKSLRRDSAPVNYRREGWDVRMYPFVRRVLHYHPTIADNFKPVVDDPEQWARQFGQLLDLGVFRVLPHGLKRHWLDVGGGPLAPRFSHWMEPEASSPAGAGEDANQPGHRDLRWLNAARADSRADADKPAFRLYHLMVPHAPFLVDADLEIHELPDDRSGYYRQSLAAIRILGEYLEILQRQGLYDRTWVLVVSDHGGGEYGAGFRHELLPAELGVAAPGVVPDAHQASGLPLVLAKPFGRRGDLEISDAPVSLADIPATLEAARNGDVTSGGLFAVDESARRSRRYLFYQFDGWDGEYLPELVEYEIAGHAWLPGSWRATGHVWPPPDGPAARGPGPVAQPLAPGDSVRPANPGPGRLYAANGWSGPEHGGIWSVARKAELDIPLARPLQRDLDLELTLEPFTAKEALPAQRIQVRVNGRDAAEWRLESLAHRRIRLSVNEYDGATRLRVELALPDATEPAAVGIGSDVRPLGVFLTEIALRSAD